MEHPLFLTNTLSGRKERFTPLNPPFAGMYVCGPTVYSDVHLGNCRTFISFDILYRYLMHLGYKVRYVRNITDAGHLEGDRDEGDDKFSKKARLEQLEPMEIVQRYTVGFHDVMKMFNNLPPSIEPTATGHIAEQIEMINQIISNGHAYEINGTIYFDVEKYNTKFPYGKLSGRNLQDLIENTRELSGQDEKKGRLDFALWIKAKPEHLMRWSSPWGWGFPGWHIECSAMSGKYLGEQFDIHGGGMDLIATHHTNEIAQSYACFNTEPVRYWIHTNMLTLNGARMSKSAGNTLSPEELFSGNHKSLSKAYTPNVVRFFMLQAHYRSTLDFSDEALLAAEKGFKKLINSFSLIDQLKTSDNSTSDVNAVVQNCYAAMNDDLNTPIVIANLFEASRIINSVYASHETITGEDIEILEKLIDNFFIDVLGLKSEVNSDNHIIDNLMELIISIRNNSRKNKDYKISDQIREKLEKVNIKIKDEKDTTTWSIR